MIGTKIKTKEDEEPEEMNMVTLAQTLGNDLDQSFYHNDIVIRMIQMQWESSKWVMISQMLIYIFLYLIPLIYYIMYCRDQGICGALQICMVGKLILY